MKKLVVLMVVLSLALMGCCTRVDPVTKVTTKSFANCVKTAQQILCNPTDAQKAEAQAVLDFLTSGVAVAGIVIPVPITAAQVATIFSMIQSGGCVLATDLVMAIDWYNSLVSALKSQKGAKAMPPTIPALQSWLK